jgi:hypothetical protein
MNAKGLYSSNTKTVLKATHILECNERPKMSGETDEAISIIEINRYWIQKVPWVPKIAPENEKS